MEREKIEKCLQYLNIARICLLIVWVTILVMILVQLDDIPQLVWRTISWCGIGGVILLNLRRWQRSIENGTL